MTSTVAPPTGIPTTTTPTTTEQAPSPVSGGTVRVTLLVSAAALVVLGICAWFGDVKIDEGWYIVSSRLAAGGALPYRDFAYTQGPFLLYALAPAQALARGILSARIVSSGCAALGIGLVVSTARRLGGNRAAVYTGLLLLSLFPALPYWLSVTKTYGLASLFLAATVATLTSGVRASIRLPLATAMAASFALTRTSGAVLAILVFMFCIYDAPDRRTRASVALAAAALAGPFLVLVGLAGDRAVWDLFSYHQFTGNWAYPQVSSLWSRLQQLVVAWPFVAVLGFLMVAALVIARDRPALERVRAHPELAIVVVGMIAFVVTHLLGGAFYAEEYVAPLVPTAAMLGVVAATRLRGSLPLGEHAVLVTALLLALILTPRSGYLDASGSTASLKSIDAVARCIDQHSTPHDRVLAFMLLEAIPAAHRTPVSGTSLGVFSYQDVSTARAEHLHVVNADLVLRAISDPSTTVVVLSNVDRQLLSFAGWFSQKRVSTAPLERELAAQYRPVCTAELVREQTYVHGTVFARVG
jgi:hypothetical protein